MKRPELLAPAGGRDALVAAVQNGADAVYLGGRQFNARRGANNFDLKELAEVIEYAHMRGVKIYVTVNILLADTELREAVRFLHAIYNAGADAAIVQDLGLIRLARLVVPELELHASTQMTAHNLPGVEFLREAGLKRVVLAREMDLDSVRHIRERAGVQLETFVHGALCICYSGQCLMSSMIGGRSGNRGRCAQPCRLEYRLVDKSGKPVADAGQWGEYLLSPKDLNLSDYVPRLMAAGIDSFKIEGRMRRPEYVATVIRIYRELIDRALVGGDFAVTNEENVDLAQIFNRGFSSGYFFGNLGQDLMSYKRPNNRGVLLGRVKHYNQRAGRVEIELEAPLAVGDGIEVWVTRGGRVGKEVHGLWVNGNKVESAVAGTVVEIEMEGHVRPGDRVFKTHNAELMNRALQSYASSREKLRIPLDMRVRARVGEPLTLEADDRDGINVIIQTGTVGEPAQRRPLTAEFLVGQLGRLGNTPFVLDGLECDIEGQVMVPVSEINDVRRRVVEMIARERVKRRLPAPLAIDRMERGLALALADWEDAAPRRFPKLAVAVSGPRAVRAAVENGAEIIYYNGEGFRSQDKPTQADVLGARKACREAGVTFIPVTPRILHDLDLERYREELKSMLELNPDGIMAAGYGLLPVLREITDLPLAADFPFNVFNRQAAIFLKEQGLFRVTLSPELTGEQVRELAAGMPLETELIVHGFMPLMVSRYCAVGSLLGGRCEDKKCTVPCRSGSFGLLDRKDVVFPVETDSSCLMHVFNSRELCLLDTLPYLAGAGLASIRIEARRDDVKYVAKTVRAYRNILDGLRDKPNRLPDLETVVRELTAQGPGYTRGHYYRGVMD
ncbi:MAG: peptidase U32 [Peptococcaceae bacterium BRH_c8a]|nr:MAG: peptidase U32 [Peptococcaceae bacterium BRH_c8a]